MNIKYGKNYFSWVIVLIFLLSANVSLSQQTQNSPERLTWFHKLGYGLFIHWSADVQIGTVISHTLVGASDEYVEKYFNELPKTFDPYNFNPKFLALTARAAGVKYVVFTTKHHSGFCMFDTKTTDFNIMNTPYGKDITRQIFDAFRSQGIAIGVYFSPDDFHFLHKAGTTISRMRPEVFPVNNPGLMSYDKRQLAELLTNYGKIDILFIDGPPEGLREYAWKIDPNLVITRGTMETPEISPSSNNNLPGSIPSAVWEACFTMGTSWAYKPTNEHYHSGAELINSLIETRAKNGNMLLNIGLKSDGGIGSEQENILREIGTWLFINGEAIYDTDPWLNSNEGRIWFTRSEEKNTVYAIIENPEISFGGQKSVVLKSVTAKADTKVSVLGQNDKVLEYKPDFIPKTTWRNTDSGLEINFFRAQRIYNDYKWPDPVVLKIVNPGTIASLH